MTENHGLARYIPGWLRRPAILRLLRAVAALVVVVIVADKLRKIGWAETWSSLPTAPGFYAVFALIYAIMPLADLAIYRRLWGIGCNAIPVLLRKRAYNELILDYAGEAFLCLWARHHVDRSGTQILSNVKDVNLLSGTVSNCVTLLLLGGVLVSGQARLLMPAGADSLRYLLVPVCILVSVSVGVLLFRRHLFALDRSAAVRIFGLHLARLTATLCLQAIQWSAALPQVSLGTWVLALAMRLLLTRLPFLPNQDVMFMWVAITLAASIDAPEQAVTAMFVAAAALSLFTHVVVLLLTSFLGGRGRHARTR